MQNREEHYKIAKKTFNVLMERIGLMEIYHSIIARYEKDQ